MPTIWPKAGRNRFGIKEILLLRVPFSMWNATTEQFEQRYTAALLISNTCDMAAENARVVPKNVVLAPCMPFEAYQNVYLLNPPTQPVHHSTAERASERLNSHLQDVRQQRVSNLFYLPTSAIGPDSAYIAQLDRVFSLPGEVLQQYLAYLTEIRLATLSDVGHFLFLGKLAYHFHRLPEEADRPALS